MSQGEGDGPMRERKRTPNFTQDQLECLINNVNRVHGQLFSKEEMKETKDIIWEDVAKEVNKLDPFYGKENATTRTAFQCKRKYIKMMSEQRVIQKKMSPGDIAVVYEASGDHGMQGDEDDEDNVNEDQNVINMILTEDQTHSTSHHLQINPDGIIQVTNPINSSEQLSKYQREKIGLLKIGMFMKMKKYKKSGILSSTEVKLITRWIKSPDKTPLKAYRTSTT